jgi:hypothetical protein
MYTLQLLQYGKAGDFLMAQVTISDEHYHALLALAQARGMTPDTLLDIAMEDLLDLLDEQAWDELLTRPESIAVLDRLAQEARDEQARGELEEWP